MNKFWMVHNVSGQGTPQQRHATLEDARHEAQRLARHHMGNACVVLEVVECWQATRPPAEQIEVVSV